MRFRVEDERAETRILTNFQRGSASDRNWPSTRRGDRGEHQAFFLRGSALKRNGLIRIILGNASALREQFRWDGSARGCPETQRRGERGEIAETACGPPLDTGVFPPASRVT